MDLNFLGRGSAFNYKEGCNSAYFVENNELFLIDCGESVFASIMENNLLENIKAVHIMITHTHSDHVGSLGTLVAYIYYILGKKANIIVPMNNASFVCNIKAVLSTFGSDAMSYNIVDETNYDNKYTIFNSVRFMQTNHVEELVSCGILFNTQKGLVYYSGDSCDLNNVDTLISSGAGIDKIYLDTTTADYPGNVHSYIGVINKKIPQNLKSKVYCMHLNSDDCISQALELGFNVVEKVAINKNKK